MLQISNITKKYKDIIALNGVSLHAAPGEIIGLVGPNGSGKTTLMKAASGLITPDGGTIEIDGLTIDKDREKYLSLLSCTIETPVSYLSLSGYDNLMLIKKLNKVSDNEFTSILDAVDLKERIRSRAGTYSLGMKQRLALGMCMLKKPRLFLLDEPVNGMDPVSMERFYEMIRRTAKQSGAAFIISSHILSDLGGISDRIYFMDYGNIIRESDIRSGEIDLKETYMSLYRRKSDENDY